MYEVIDLSSVRFSEQLAECQVIHVLVPAADIEGVSTSLAPSNPYWGEKKKRNLVNLGDWSISIQIVGSKPNSVVDDGRAGECGEVEEVVSVLTPVVGGVAQAFHDLLVELRLLLVAEVEEGEEEDRQEESWEVESGEDQREERTLTWMAMKMDVKGARLKLEPM